MKRFLTALLLLACLSPLARAAAALDTLIIHPEETIYARFEVTAKKIKLVALSKEPDAGAQVVFHFHKDPDPKKKTNLLKVENRFSSDLVYTAEMRSLTLKQQFRAPVTPVVANKVSYDSFPTQVEEIAAFDFKLEK
jgi:hypothetical protein